MGKRLTSSHVHSKHLLVTIAFFSIALILMFSAVSVYVSHYSERSRAMVQDDGTGGGTSNTTPDEPDDALDPKLDQAVNDTADVLDIPNPTEPPEDTHDQDEKNNSPAPTNRDPNAPTSKPCHNSLPSGGCLDNLPGKEQVNNNPYPDPNTISDPQVKARVEAQQEMQKQQELVQLVAQLMQMMNQMTQSTIQNIK